MASPDEPRDDDAGDPSATETVKAASRRVTSADVAKASGVSRATVSYVLNDVPGHRISSGTRELVLRTARRLGHVPYAPARSLRLGRSNVVLALVRDFAIGYISNRILRRLDLALADRGYVLLAHRYDESVRTLGELWGMVAPGLVVAMGGLSMPELAVIEGTQTKLLRVQGMVPHEKAGRMQAEHLHARGHTRLGYAFPSEPTLELIAGERLAGVRAAADDLGLPAPMVITVDPEDPWSVGRALDQWQRGVAPVTGVCAHNDEIGLGISEALAARQLVAGRDLAIIGVDDIPAARFRLSTVKIDVDAWAEATVRSVLSLLDGAEPVATADDFLRLIPRETS